MRADPLLVVVAGMVLSAPVLLQTLAQDLMPMETALARMGMLLAVAWCGVAALGALLRATAETPRRVESRPAQASDERAAAPETDVP